MDLDMEDYEGDDKVKLDKKTNFISTQIPLAWLITVFVISVIFMIGVATSINTQNHDLANKMEAISSTLTDMKKRLDERDTSFQALRELQYTMQRELDLHELRLGNLERRPSK